MFTLSLINPATNNPFFTHHAVDAVWSTTRAGEERLRAVIDNVSLSEAVNLFDKSALAYVRISKNAERVWSGVVTDVQLAYSNNSYSLIVNAVGYAFIFNNTHITALFSTTDTSQFIHVRNTELTQSVYDSRVRVDTSQYIFVNIRAGSVFQANERVCVAYRCPDKALSTVQYVQVRCSTLPTNFVFELYCLNNAPSGSAWTVLHTISNLATNTTHSITLPNAYSTIVFAIRATTVTTVSTETNVAINNVRLLTTSAPVTASKIMQLRGVRVINNVSQESDLLNVVVEDKTDAELFDMICQQDNLEYETLTYKVVELRKRNELTNRTKYRIVADTLNIARDATTIANNIYARYKDVANRTLRTQRVDDAVARDVYANSIVRDAYIDVDTYSESVANAKRNEALRAMRTGSMRLRATTRNVATLSQSPVPLWQVRAGSVVGIVNLGQIGYGQVSEVIIDRTDYDAATDTLTIEAQLDSFE